MKATWRLFQQISADTKDLCDIPRFWPQAERLRLPWVQYSAREVRSGLFFWAFAQRRSAAASAVFAARIQQHLDRYGISLRDLVCSYRVALLFSVAASPLAAANASSSQRFCSAWSACPAIHTQWITCC